MAAICVLGAGVSGLTTAIELMQHGHQVSVFADAIGSSTTSSAAAAFWYPFWTGTKPDHSWYRPIWAWETFLELEKIANSHPAAGVTRTGLLEYYDADMTSSEVEQVIDSMWWRVLSRTAYRDISSSEASDVILGLRSFQSGSTIQTYVVNMASYLPWLEDKLTGLGVSVTSKHVEPDHLPVLFKKFDYIVNCCGLGSRKLISDLSMEPKEGVVVRIRPIEAIKNIILLHTGPFFSERPVYIVPRGGTEPDIILGGTIRIVEGTPRHLQWPVPGNELRIRADAGIILRLCAEIEPALKTADILGVSVGYRPTRPTARVEPEFVGSFAGRLIHNYGHGGGGVTLSWGCAREVTRWIGWLCDSPTANASSFVSRHC